MSNLVFYLEGSGPADTFIQQRIRKFFGAEVVAKRPEAGLVVTLTPNNPILDEVLLSDMIKAAERTGQSFKPVDAIPGTEPLQVGTGTPHEYFYNSQHRYCTNFSIGRPNRRQIFERLAQQFLDLSDWPLDRVITFIESDAGVDFVVAYGEPVSMERITACPSCEGDLVTPLFSGTNHPITGFITKNVSIYSHCLECGLTFLSRQMPKNELWRYYQEHSYANPLTASEYKTFLDSLSEKNVSHYANYLAVADYVAGLSDNARVGDLGAGRGEFGVFLKGIKPNADVTLFDWRFAPFVLEELKSRNIKAISGDFQKYFPTTPLFDLITAWEVLEHLKVNDLHSLIASIRRSLRKGAHFIFSTPDFNNTYTRALDFWAACPGEHLTVLSRRYLEPFLTKAGFEIVGELHEAVMLKKANDWFAFGAATNIHFSAKATSSMIDDVLQDDKARMQIRQRARENQLGSELILICKAL